MISTIEDETVKTKVTNFYSTEKAKIENINDIDSAKEIGATVLKDSEDFIKEVGAELLKTLKKNAKDNLDKIVNEGLTKLPSESLKQSLNTYYQTEIQKIDAINSIDGASDTIDEVTNDTKLYIKELVASTLADAKKLMKEYLDKVVSASKVSPYSFIPESMKPGYSNNLVTASDVTYDFSNFVNVSSIKYGGFGEQWNMVIDNITQSEKMNSVLTKGETVLNTSVTLFKEYLDNKYSDSLEYEITKEGFTALINFEDGILSYTLTYTTGLSIPLFGEVTPIVSMYLDSSTNIKYITIKLTETNVLKYTVTDNSYKFEMNYGVDQASRTAYLNIEKDSNNKVTGKIYEFITVAGKTISNSCADFYIDNEYVTAVGNKADGIVGLDGYINELYKVSDGKLLGYKIRETKTVAKISGTYHTLWFNLSDISGITSIKVLDHDKGNSSNSNDIYINGSDKVFTPTYNKKYGVSTSRKYDIELRTQYFYSYDEVNKEYISHEVQIPMMFIQDDNDTDTNYKDYSSNILSANSITSEVKLSSTYLEKIRDDYSTLIDIFITNKETITADTIKEDLGITKTE